MEQPPSCSLNENQEYQMLAWQLPGRERTTSRNKKKDLMSLKKRQGYKKHPYSILEMVVERRVMVKNLELGNNN